MTEEQKFFVVFFFFFLKKTNSGIYAPRGACPLLKTGECQSPRSSAGLFRQHGTGFENMDLESSI